MSVSGVLAALAAGCSSPSESSPTPADPTPTPSLAPVPTPSPTPAPEASPTPDLPNPSDRPDTPTPAPSTPTPTLPPENTPYPEPTYALNGPIDVFLDDAGVPHIYASSDADAVWAQGYFSMRDRMWHLDFNRRVGYGRISEVLGEGYYQADLLYRALDFRAYAEEIYTQLKARDAEAAEILEAYAAGVNAYLDAALAGKDGASLSPQIEALGYVPDPWHPVDSLVIDKLLTFNLSTNLDIDLAVTLVSQLLALENAYLPADLIRPMPVDPTVIVPGFYGTSLPPPNPNAATALLPGWNLTPEQVRQTKDAIEKISEIHDLFQGSNNWLVSGEHTASGYPLLANDTHEGVEAPATYIQMHLNSLDQGGTLDVAGYNFPGAPLVGFGHNRASAWAVTNNFADVYDIYQEQVRNGAVRFNNENIPISYRQEVIRVRQPDGTVAGAEPRVISMGWVPHHGPILPSEVTGGIPATLSVAWTGYRNTDAGFVHSIDFLLGVARAQTWTEFQAAIQDFHVGAMNFVYANVDGEYGYTGRIDIPIREKLDPSNPPYGIVPGQGEHEWTGALVPDDRIPYTYLPERGFIVTANNDPSGNVQDGDVYNDPVFLSAIYDNGMRAYRITELIEEAIAAGPVTPETFDTIQADTRSRMGEHLVPFLVQAARNRPDLVTGDLATAIGLLEDWDYNTRTDSAASLAFHTWLGFLFREIFEDESFSDLFDDLTNDYVNMLVRPTLYFLYATQDSIDEIEAGTQPFPSQSGLNFFDNQNTPMQETRDQTLISSFERTVEWLLENKGPVASWNWGDHHQITFNDKVGAWLPEASSGPYTEDGGMFTVDPAEFRLNRGGVMEPVFDITGGPSQRTIYSVEPAGIQVWDIQPGGQSERPGDPHFNDQVERYLNNEQRPRPFSRAQVEAAATQTYGVGTNGVIQSRWAR